MSDNSIRRFVTILEPLIVDLDDKKKELLENISRFLAYTKDKYETVGIYADQDLIMNHLENVGYSLEEYKASCYLLKSDDSKVKGLPQYEKACELIRDIVNFFSQYKVDLTIQIQLLNDVCNRKEMEKKYYDIFSNSDPYVKDIGEFENIIDDYDLTNDEKINILVSTINSNMANYKSGNK